MPDGAQKGFESASSCRPPSKCKTLRHVLGGGCETHHQGLSPACPSAGCLPSVAATQPLKQRVLKTKNSTMCSSYFERLASLMAGGRRVWGQMGLLSLVIPSRLPGPSPRDSPFSELRAHHLHTRGKNRPYHGAIVRVDEVPCAEPGLLSVPDPRPLFLH